MKLLIILFLKMQYSFLDYPNEFIVFSRYISPSFVNSSLFESFLYISLASSIIMSRSHNQKSIEKYYLRNLFSRSQQIRYTLEGLGVNSFREWLLMNPQTEVILNHEILHLRSFWLPNYSSIKILNQSYHLTVVRFLPSHSFGYLKQKREVQNIIQEFCLSSKKLSSLFIFLATLLMKSYSFEDYQLYTCVIMKFNESDCFRLFS